MDKPKLNFARLKVKLGEEVNFKDLIHDCREKINALNLRSEQAQTIN